MTTADGTNPVIEDWPRRYPISDLFQVGERFIFRLPLPDGAVPVVENGEWKEQSVPRQTFAFAQSLLLQTCSDQTKY